MGHECRPPPLLAPPFPPPAGVLCTPTLCTGSDRRTPNSWHFSLLGLGDSIGAVPTQCVRGGVSPARDSPLRVTRRCEGGGGRKCGRPPCWRLRGLSVALLGVGFYDDQSQPWQEDLDDLPTTGGPATADGAKPFVGGLGHDVSPDGLRPAGPLGGVPAAAVLRPCPGTTPAAVANDHSATRPDYGQLTLNRAASGGKAYASVPPTAGGPDTKRPLPQSADGQHNHYFHQTGTFDCAREPPHNSNSSAPAPPSPPQPPSIFGSHTHLNWPAHNHTPARTPAHPERRRAGGGAHLPLRSHHFLSAVRHI